METEDLKEQRKADRKKLVSEKLRETVEETPKDIPQEAKPRVDERKPLVEAKSLDHALSSTTLEGRYRHAQMAISGGMVPKSYKTPEQVLAAFEFARELSLPPMSAIRNIAVINGQPSLWGDLPLTLVRTRSKRFRKIYEFVFDKNYKKICFDNKNLDAQAWGALCRTWDKDDGDDEYYETYFTLEDAKTAGLLGRDNVWKTYPRRMLQMRTRSQNLKDQYGDALFGISITEYDFNTLPQIKDVGPFKNEMAHNGEAIINQADLVNQALAEEQFEDESQTEMPNVFC